MTNVINDTLKIDTSNVFENILNKYDNVSYHFTLYLVNELKLYGSSKGAETAFKNADKVIIAQTGTTSFYIDNVNFKSYISPSDEYFGANTTQMKMTIIEPHGSSLFDRMYLAAIELDIPNYKNVPLYLELKFYGYDPHTGKAIDILREEAKTYSSYIYRVNFTNVAASVETSGTTYNIDGFASSSLALNDELGKLPVTLKVFGDKFVDRLRNLVTEWNKAAEEKHLTTSTPLYKYKIVLVKDNPTSSNQIVWDDLIMKADETKVPTTTANSKPRR